MDRVAILLLSAGASARMRGADKLLEPVDGVPVLRRQAQAALALHGPVLVTLPPDRPNRAVALDGLKVRRVPVPDASRGMAASIRAGVAAMPKDMAGVMILPADMPEIDAGDLRAVRDAFEQAGGTRITRGASATGVPGHPVLFPACRFPELARVHGDIGAREVLKGAQIVLVPLPGQHALTDLDTPEQWAAWRAARMTA